jgi:hypothetical protein
MKNKTLKLILILLTTSFTFSEGLEAKINKVNFLSCVAELETGNNYTLIGSSGERSQFQFTHQTWSQHTEIFFEVASIPYGQTLVLHVAQVHLDWLIKYLSDRNYPVTVYNLAACWNAGIGRFHRNELQERHRDYAERVLNLYGAKIILINNDK